MVEEGEDSIDPLKIGSATDTPPITEKPYKIIFEASKCIGAGRCAEVSGNWELSLETGVAVPNSYFIGEDELDENIAAAARCPAKRGAGVIHVIDRRTGEELAPNPHGDGVMSVDW